MPPQELGLELNREEISSPYLSDFQELLSPEEGERRTRENLASHQLEYLKTVLFQESQLVSLDETNREEALIQQSSSPNQGLLTTPYDNLLWENCQSVTPLESSAQLSEETETALLFRQWELLIANHPSRLEALKRLSKKDFEPPPKIESTTVKEAITAGECLVPADLGSEIIWVGKERSSRRELLSEGPFVKLGRQARLPFVGSAMPDCWGSVSAISTMAASHCLCGIPKDGPYDNVEKQVRLAEGVFDFLENTAETVLGKENKEILQMWRKNVMGVLETNPEKALERAKKLYEVGVRTFRVYSPEPGMGILKTLITLRENFGQDIEIFCGQVVKSQVKSNSAETNSQKDINSLTPDGIDTKDPLLMARLLEYYGANGLYVGIGGGGRCKTGTRSGSLVDWPSLVWQMRGKIGIPVIAEGGASDDLKVSWLLGVTGIGVSRAAVGGTIEQPGGALYLASPSGRLFKPYGGEASARAKWLKRKMMPFGIAAFDEGETAEAWQDFSDGPITMARKLWKLNTNAALALVFCNVKSISELQSLNHSPLKRATAAGKNLQGIH